MRERRVSRGPAATQLLITAGWLGAGLVLAAVVAPAAFAVLPDRTLAGALVGRVLPPIFYSGIATGLAGVWLARATGGRLVTMGTVAGLVIAISCALAQLVVAPRIEHVRAAIAGPVGGLAAGDARRAEFGRLHGASVLLLAVGMLGAAASAGAAVAALRRER